MKRIEILPAVLGLIVGAIALAAASGANAVAPPAAPTDVGVSNQPSNLGPAAALAVASVDAAREATLRNGRTPDRAEADARPDEVTESSCNCDHHTLPYEEQLGQKDFVRDAPFDGPATSTAIGIGGGHSGIYGNRDHRRGLVDRGGSRETEVAVWNGLRWLKTHQDPDGFWDCDGFHWQCRLYKCNGVGDASGDQVVTSLALLAFLGAGETDRHGKHKKVVKNGLKYLKKLQGPDGRFGIAASPAFDYGHAVSTLVMCEVSDLTGSPLFKLRAQRAIDAILARALPNDGDAIWSILAIQCGKRAGLKIADSALDRCRYWLDERTTESGAFHATSGSLIESSLALQAAAAHARAHLGEDPATSRQPHTAVNTLKGYSANRLSLADPVALHFGALVAHARGGDTWSGFNAAMKEALLPAQQGELRAYEFKSWNSTGPVGRSLGRVGTTALMTMCLETYYRFRWD